MASENLDVGTTANDGTGDALRDAFIKIRKMFAELYGQTYSSDTQDLSGATIDIDHGQLADRYTARAADITADGGGEEIDWSSGAIFKVTLTADDTLNFSNYKKGQVIDMITNGDFTITLGTTSGTPVINQVGSGTYDSTTDNLIQVTCTDDDATPEFFYSVGTYSADTDPA
jgi:hypothetical protein